MMRTGQDRRATMFRALLFMAAILNFAALTSLLSATLSAQEKKTTSSFDQERGGLRDGRQEAQETHQGG